MGFVEWVSEGYARIGGGLLFDVERVEVGEHLASTKHSVSKKMEKAARRRSVRRSYVVRLRRCIVQSAPRMGISTEQSAGESLRHNADSTMIVSCVILRIDRASGVERIARRRG